MNAQDSRVLRATDSFQQVSCAAPSPDRNKQPAPFSLRLTAEERSVRGERAGGRPLGAYIRDRLLRGQIEPRRELSESQR